MAPKITIVGCGPGSRRYLTGAAIEAVNEAEVLVGAQRLLDLFPDAARERIAVTKGINLVLDRLEKLIGKRRTALLVSGDPGLFSLARLVIQRFGREACRVIPGVSSVQAAFAAIGLDWADARIISAHKDSPSAEVVRSLRKEEKIAVLAGRADSLRWTADLLAGFDEEPKVFVCEELTLDAENVREVPAADLPKLEVGSRTVVIIVRRDPFL